MKKSLLKLPRTVTFACACAVLSFLFLSSFDHSDFSKEKSIDDCLNDPITLLYNGHDERFKLYDYGQSEKVAFCNLEPNKEYQLYINTFYESDCQPMIIDEAGDLIKKMKFTSLNTCFEIDVNNFCKNKNMITVLTLQKIEPFDPSIFTKPSEDNPELPVLTVAGGQSAQSLIEDVFIGGGCFDVTNVLPIGSAAGRGTFANGNSTIGFSEGIILSTGAITGAPGPNNSNSTTSGNGGGSDPDLALVVPQSINDATGIQFNFQPTVSQVFFNFAFASEEYCEFVGTQFNDVFGFFISGPGINGFYTNNAENIATISGTAFPVTIGNVNHQFNQGFFNSNDPPGVNACGASTNNVDIQFDGYTNSFTAIANVQPCGIYTIRLVIGDVSDGAYDSAVFLEAGSFDAGGNASGSAEIPSTGTDVIYEGCGDGFLTFTRESNDLLQPLNIQLVISPTSTATNGVDITPSIPTSVTIPPGLTEWVIPISAIADGIPEGVESFIIEIVNSCSCNNGTIELEIHDVPPIEVLPDEMISHCANATVSLNPGAIGGVPPLNYIWSTGATSPTLTPFVTASTVYTVTVSDLCGNVEEYSATVDISANNSANIFGVAEICPGVTTGLLTIEFTGSPPWSFIPLIDGVPQAPISNVMTSPYIYPVSQVGNYTLLNVEGNNCPGIGQGVGVVMPTLVDAVFQVMDASCEGQADGIVDLLPYAGQQPWSFAWSNNTFQEDLELVPAGTYTVTITDANGCPGIIENIVVGEGGALTVAGVALTTPDCNSPNGGSIDLTVNGSGNNYTFNWDNGAQAVEDPTGLSAGVYNVTVTDGGCSTETSVTIPDNSTQPTVVVNTNPPALGCNSGAITLDGNGSSTGNFSYLWTTTNGNIVSGETTLNPNVDMAGDYQLVITDNSNGCTNNATVTVTGSTEVPVVMINNMGQSIDCINATLILDGTGSSTNNVSYLWTTSSGNIVSGSTTLNPTINAPGMYTLQVTNNANGCPASATIIISDNLNNPNAVANMTAMIDCNSNNTVTLDGNGSSTGSTMAYLWTTTNGVIVSDETTLTPTVSAAGTYQLLVTDTSNGCDAEITVTVTSDVQQPTVNIITPNNLTCTTMEISLDGNGSSAGTYLWTTTDGNIISGNTTLNPTIDEPGTYQLEVTTANGCVNTSSVTVGENITQPNVNAGTADPFGCNTMSVLLNGSSSTSGVTYLWTTTDGSILSGSTSFNPSVNAPGTYTLVVTDPNTGCTNMSSVTVAGSTEQPDANAGMATNLTCDNTELALNGNGSASGTGVTYLWTTTDGNIVSGNTTLNPTIDEPGTYQIEVTGANGCTNLATVTIGDNSVDPVAVATAPSPLDCGTPSVSLDGNGSASGSGITYLWTTTDGTILSGNTTLNPEISTSGTYELQVTNSNTGCIGNAMVTITANNDEPTVVIAPTSELTCGTTSLSLDGTGSDMGDYLWTTTDGNIVSGSTTLNPTIDEPGTYQLEVISSNGCNNTSTITVGENISEPDVEAGTADPFGCTTTAVSLSGSSSSTGVTYLWTTTNGTILSGETTLTPSVGAAGTYTLVVTDSNTGCMNESSVTVVGSTDLPTADAGVVDDFTCLVTDFTLDGSGSDAGNGITYLWTTMDGTIVSDETTLTPMVTGVGTYSLLVTNMNTGCSSTSTVTVIDNTTPPNVAFDTPPTLGCGQSSASLSGAGSSTGTEYAYQWTTTNGSILSGETTLNPEINTAGTYELLITNTITGCIASDEITVIADSDVPVAIAGTADDITCLVEMVTLDGGASSTGMEFTYLWTTTNGNIVSGETTLSPIVDADGTYELLVTNTVNGCDNISTVIVATSTDLPTVNPGTIATIDCDNPTITLDGSASSTGTEFSYSWTTMNGNIISGETTLTPAIDMAGVYTLSILNNLTGCSDVTDITVTGDAIEPIAFINIADPITCLQNTTSLDGNGSSVGTDFTYQWSTMNGNIVSGETTLEPIVDAAGTYELVVTNTQNGCTEVETINVTIDGDLPDAFAGDDGLINCNITSTTLNGTGDAGTDITYLWTTTDGNILSGENTLTPEVDAAGTYQLTVSNNANGCDNTSTVSIVLDDTAPTVNVGIAPMISCSNTTVSLDGSGSSTGNYTYLWTTANGNIVSDETTLSPMVNAAGTYVLTVTSLDNGCTHFEEVEVMQDNGLPSADAGTGFEITCDVLGGTLDGTASTTGADITYLWTTTDGNIVSGETTLTPEIDAAGTYQLLLTNTVNDCISLASVIIPENNTPPTADAGMQMELNCINPTLVIDGTNSQTGTEITYLWTTTDGTIMSGETSPTPEITAAGTYELLVTNTTSGCFSNTSVVITESFEEPSIDIIQPMELNCNSNTTSIDGTGSSIGTSFTYLWTTTNGNILSGETTLEPQVDAAGDYELLITNTSNGCVTSDMITVTQSVDLPNADAVVIDNLTCTTTEITLGGGNSSVGTEYEYLWTTTNGNILLGNTTLTPTVDEPGDYILTVTNTLNSCVATSQVTVQETVELPTAVASIPALLTCTVIETQLDGNGSSIGTEFTYLWTTPNGTIISGETTLTPTVGAVGTYELQVTNSLTGCVANTSTDVDSNGDLPAAVAAPEGMLTCNTSSIGLTGIGSATGNNFTYLWTTTDGNIISGETTLNPVVDETGTYLLVVTNTQNGCVGQVSTIVENNITNPSAIVDPTVSLLLDCENSSLVIDGSGSTPIGNVSYLWTTINGNIISGATTANPEVNEAGTYTLLVTDLTNGCTNEIEVEIDQDLSVPEINISNPEMLTCDVTEIVLSATGPATGNYSYEWTTPNGNISSGAIELNPTVNQPGDYTLIITNLDNNCQNSASISVAENTTEPTAVASVDDMLDCETTSATINGNGSSVGNNFTYEWTTTNGNIVGNNNTLSVTADAAGIYNLIVTDSDNGCTATANTALTQDETAPSDILFTIEDPKCAGEQGDILIETVEGGTPPYVYSVDGENFHNGHIFTLPGGDYILYAQDANGCEVQTEFSIPILTPVSLAVAPEANFNVGEDYTIETLTNIPFSEIESISWAPINNLSCTDCLNPTIEQLFENTTYTITITNIYGCVTSASIEVGVDKDRSIYLPNVFTPNGDGNNDFFMIYAGPNAQIVSIKNFHVFDRWGEVVYTATDFPPNDAAYGWDGNLRGQKLNPAVFVYWFEVEFLDGETIIYEGDVALRRH